jgi:predicted negative regulator of RcsB-dependent stress response
MAEDTILTWNVANWITVLIMVILGFAILGMAARIWQQRRAKMAA